MHCSGITESVAGNKHGVNLSMKVQLYDKSKIEWDHLTFSNMDLRRLIIPLMIEQFLNSLMGMADTMMVSRAGEAAISAVSLVDAVNILITQVFTALATGGTIICAQYIGRKDEKESNRAARQVVWHFEDRCLHSSLDFIWVWQEQRIRRWFPVFSVWQLCSCGFGSRGR